MHSPLKPIGVKLEPALKDRLQRIGAVKHRSPHWMMKEAIREYIEREEAAERLRQETLQAWAAFQQDGKHVAHEAMTAWLNSWGTESETGRPE